MNFRSVWWLAVCLWAGSVFGAEVEWARFRGPDGAGSGDLSAVPDQPTEKDFRWNVALPGAGHSSPVLWGKRVFTGCEDAAGKRRCLVALDAETGEIVWTTWFACGPQHLHDDNSLAAATPVVDGDGVYVGWVSNNRVEVAAVDHAGKEIWRRELGEFEAKHGPGASVIVVDDTVVVTNDQESAEAAIHGLDRKTGKTLWRIVRRNGNPSYATPATRRGADGRVQVLVSSPAHGLTAIDPRNGVQRWAVEGLLELNVVASPVYQDDLVLVTSGRGGSRDGAVVAIEGDSAKLLYRPEAKLPYVPTPVATGGHLFLWEDQGTVTCLEFRSGKKLWSERVCGPTYSSPVTDGKRLFGISRKGEMVAIAAAPVYQELGRMPLPEGTHATPAIAHGSLFVRTFSRLIRIGK